MGEQGLPQRTTSRPVAVDEGCGHKGLGHIAADEAVEVRWGERGTGGTAVDEATGWPRVDVASMAKAARTAVGDVAVDKATGRPRGSSPARMGDVAVDAATR